MTQETTKQRAVCGARKRQGEGRCQRPAGWGTDHVGFGTCKLHGGRMPTHEVAAARAEASSHLAVSGIPVDPATALLRCVQLAAGQVEYASRQLALTGDPDSEDPIHTSLSAWGRVQAEGMDRLARYSKMALDAGVAEITVRLAERDGEALAKVIRSALEELELSAEQQALAPAAIQKHLSPLEGYPT